MPAKAGIHLRACCKAKENLDSGPGSSPGQVLRRNDGRKGRLPVDKFTTHRLKTNGRSVANGNSRTMISRWFKAVDLSAMSLQLHRQVISIAMIIGAGHGMGCQSTDPFLENKKFARYFSQVR
jgi:hypothetical protein